MPTPEATRAEVMFAGMNKTPNAIMITLPWPSRVLSPNGRSHWAAKAAEVKRCRQMAWALTLEQLGGKKPGWTAATLHWEFHPKTAHKVDGDNAESACKAFRDGIADALGMDDANFTTSKQFGPPVKGGAVIVSIRGE